jgi:hypothetical protein
MPPCRRLLVAYPGGNGRGCVGSSVRDEELDHPAPDGIETPEGNLCGQPAHLGPGVPTALIPAATWPAPQRGDPGSQLPEPTRRCPLCSDPGRSRATQAPRPSWRPALMGLDRLAKGMLVSEPPGGSTDPLWV